MRVHLSLVHKGYWSRVGGGSKILSAGTRINAALKIINETVFSPVTQTQVRSCDEINSARMTKVVCRITE